MNIKLKLFVYLLLISVSSLGFAVDNGTWTYDINSDGLSITLTGTSSFPSEPAGLTIPETIDGYDVTVIGDSAFTNQYITSLSLPTTLITIGENAFSYNWLTLLTIPENVVNIKDYAFLDQANETNEKLQSLTLGSSVASIGTQAFKRNELTSILFPSTVQSIGEEAFSFTELTIAQFQGNRPTIKTSSFIPSFSLERIEYCLTASGWPGESISSGGFLLTAVPSVLICGEDSDWDEDGVSDVEDNCPYLPNPNQTDTDGNSLGNLCDTDDDGDGFEDENDAFPLDATESVDTDSDGIGNNSDEDDDGDGFEDENDAFPLDPNEWIDSDSDGIGNNADVDDDGDGVSDVGDNCPEIGLDKKPVFQVMAEY